MADGGQVFSVAPGHSKSGYGAAEGEAHSTDTGFANAGYLGLDLLASV